MRYNNIVRNDSETEYRIDDVAGDIAKVAFHINEEVLNEIMTVARALKLPMEHIKIEYIHLHFFMVSLAVFSFAEEFERGEYFIKQFLEKAVFCLMAPEIFAESFTEVGPDEFFEKQKQRGDLYQRVFNKEGNEKLFLNLAFALAECCGSEEYFTEIMPLCIPCQAVSVSVAEHLRSIKFIDD